MGPLINERASREDLIARIDTLEAKVTELSINEIGLEDIIRALERSNEVQAKRIALCLEDIGKLISAN